MARTRTVEATRLALDHPAIKTAHLITGLLLQLPRHARGKVIEIVQQQLTLALYVEPLVGENGDVPVRDDEPELPGLRLHDGDDEPAVLGAGISSGDTGE